MYLFKSLDSINQQLTGINRKISNLEVRVLENESTVKNLRKTVGDIEESKTFDSSKITSLCESQKRVDQSHSKLCSDLKSVKEQNTKLRLFDSVVAPILLYASEVWGIYGYDHVDKVHIKFCKKLLGVRVQAPNYAVYGDLGRFPLSVIAKERSIKYWLKLLTNRNSVMTRIFQSQIDEIVARAHARPSRYMHKLFWADGIKSLLDELGFSHMWLNQDLQIPSYDMIRNRIRDHFTQNWYATISDFSKLAYYCQFKTGFKLEKYVECISHDSLRSELAAFRLSAHNLEIERGRHFGVSRQNRKCRLCSMGMVESEYHFLLVCPLYTDLRRSFLTRSSWPSVAEIY